MAVRTLKMYVCAVTLLGVVACLLAFNRFSLSTTSTVVVEPWSPLQALAESPSHATGMEKKMYETGPDVHPQCSRGNPSDWKNRPMLIFKTSRTGSTWLAWSAEELTLRDSMRKIMFVHEAHLCAPWNSTNEQKANDVATWLIEYFSRVTNGPMMSKSSTLPKRCKVTATTKPHRLDALLASFLPSEVFKGSSSISPEGWKKIFRAVPDLAIGLQVRTNTVKHAISKFAATAKSDPCENQWQLRADDPCTRDLPDQRLTLDASDFGEELRRCEKHRDILIDTAARISREYGDGRLFCVTYESMQHDFSGELAALGDYIGAPIDEGSLDQLMQKQVTYKRVSDDFSKYLKNYEEIRDLLSTNPCILKQLESHEPENFSSCGLTNQTAP